MQYTLNKSITFSGKGLHTGKPVHMEIKPAPGNSGIVFHRTDTEEPTFIKASWENVEISPLCTKLVKNNQSVSTIEHIMAALSGCGIHNALVEVNAPEIPIMDGSSVAFVREILNVGRKKTQSPLRYLTITKPVEVSEGSAFARLEPSNNFVINFEIDFKEKAIGFQKKSLKITPKSFARHLSASRTFCMESDISSMQNMGLALGGVPGENSIVFGDNKVKSQGGLRFRNEPVRHKMLDAVGDLALAGYPILGKYTGVKAGHALTNKLLVKLFTASQSSYVLTGENVKERPLWRREYAY